jgi:hypothetical protein
MPVDNFSSSLGVALGAVLLALPLRPVHACSCAVPAPELAYDQASAVFVGTVANIERPFTDWIGITNSGDHLIHFTVTKRWKGVTPAIVTIRAPLTGEACGYPFREGEAYLVYAVGSVRLASGLCSGTKELSIAGKDLQAIEALARTE